MFRVVQRTQIYLDESDTAMLDAEAREAGRTRSEVIRSLIAEHLQERRLSEAELIAGQKRALLSLGSIGRDLRSDLDASREADRRRQDGIDARWDVPA